MGKQQSTYHAYTASDLKSRASIPAQADIVVNSNNIDCSNIKMSDVKAVLVESSYSLYDLCRSVKVNRNSRFGYYRYSTY
jgi:hypothetical protein